MYELYEKQGTIFKKRYVYKRRIWYVKRLQSLAVEGKGKWFLFLPFFNSLYKVRFEDGTFELHKLEGG